MPLLSFVQGAIVTSYRKPAKVPYPNAYASPQQVKEDKAAYKFNCAQRAHGNLLENLPQTIIYTLVAGLQYPIPAAGLGAAWILARILYVYGYVTSDKPNGNGRKIGGLFWFAQGGLWMLCGSMALKMLN